MGRRAAVLPLLFLMFAACASTQPRSVTALSDRLFCGRTIPGGGEVSDAEVEAFLEEVVEPRTPQGFTVWQAEGRWEGGAEKTLVIEVVHPLDPDWDRRMREIAEEYRRRFRQEAVFRVVAPARMELITAKPLER